MQRNVAVPLLVVVALICNTENKWATITFNLFPVICCLFSFLMKFKILALCESSNHKWNAMYLYFHIKREIKNYVHDKIWTCLLHMVHKTNIHTAWMTKLVFYWTQSIPPSLPHSPSPPPELTLKKLSSEKNQFNKSGDTLQTRGYHADAEGNANGWAKNNVAHHLWYGGHWSTKLLADLSSCLWCHQTPPDDIMVLAT